MYLFSTVSAFIEGQSTVGCIFIAAKDILGQNKGRIDGMNVLNLSADLTIFLSFFIFCSLVSATPIYSKLSNHSSV